MSYNVQTIRDPHTGAFAEIAVDFGFNCFRFCGNVMGAPREVLWSVPDFATAGGRPSGNGIPILFPFAGRLRTQTFEYLGNTYDTGTDDGHGNSIHGFVLGRPWRVVDQGTSHLVGEFQAGRDAPEILTRWPSDFLIRAEYRLTNGELQLSLLVQNPDSKVLPCGLGLHPYFRVPPGGVGSAENCRVHVPVQRYWELDGMLPTSRILPVNAERDLDHGLPFISAKLDDVFTGVRFTAGKAVGIVEETRSKVATSIRFGEEFRHCVVYVPPHREAFCIEPYTTAPDSFALAKQGISADLVELRPGGSFRAAVTIEISHTL